MFIKNHLTTLALGIVAILCIVFAVIVSVSGPKISRQSFDDDLQNQKLILTFNSPIVSIADDYTIFPYTESEVVLNDRQVTILFPDPLSYDTHYTLTLTVTDNRNKTSVVQPSFRTNNPDIYYLERQQNDDDLIRKTRLADSDDDKVMFTHDSIIMYGVAARSLLAVVEEADEKIIKLQTGSTIRDIDIPVGLSPVAVDGSHSLNAYLFTLINEVFKSEIWFYDVDKNEWLQLTDRDLNPKYGTNAVFAPDGKTIIYLDENLGLILDNPFDDQLELNLGVFDSLLRFLPNQTALFGIRANQYVGVVARDASEFVAPDSVQSTPRTLIFNNMSDYAVVKQNFDTTTSELMQEIGVYKNDIFSVFSTHPSSERLIIGLTLSPNDQFMLYEEAIQPVIYDSFSVNNKPLTMATKIISSKNGEVIRTLNGFNVLWR